MDAAAVISASDNQLESLRITRKGDTWAVLV